jgi:hypothetical protein
LEKKKKRYFIKNTKWKRTALEFYIKQLYKIKKDRHGSIQEYHEFEAPGLHNKIQISLSYMVRPCLKKQKQNSNT